MASAKSRFYKEFGKRLTAARKAAGYTQEALAKSVGLSRPSIVNVEKGRQPVHFHLAALLATLLGTTVVKLLPPIDTTLAGMASRLDLMKAKNRSWVERVISGSVIQKEVADGTQVLTSTSQGKRAAARSKG